MAKKEDHFVDGLINSHRGRYSPSWRHGKAWRDTIDGIGAIGRKAGDQLGAIGTSPRTAPVTPAFPPLHRPYADSTFADPIQNVTPRIPQQQYSYGPAYTSLPLPVESNRRRWVRGPFRPGWWREISLMEACDSLADDLHWTSKAMKCVWAVAAAILTFIAISFAPWWHLLAASPGLWVLSVLAAIVGWILPVALSFVIRGCVWGLSWLASIVTWAVVTAAVAGIAYGITAFAQHH